MAYFDDLGVCNYYSILDASNLRAVGWLARGKPFVTGEVEAVVFEKLCELTQSPWCPIFMLGSHSCDLCRFTGTGAGRYYRKDGAGRYIQGDVGYVVGASSKGVSLFVPADGVIYLSPTNITHYIDAHG